MWWRSLAEPIRIAVPGVRNSGKSVYFAVLYGNNSIECGDRLGDTEIFQGTAILSCPYDDTQTYLSRLYSELEAGRNPSPTSAGEPTELRFRWKARCNSRFPVPRDWYTVQVVLHDVAGRLLEPDVGESMQQFRNAVRESIRNADAVLIPLDAAAPQAAQAACVSLVLELREKHRIPVGIMLFKADKVLRLVDDSAEMERQIDALLNQHPIFQGIARHVRLDGDRNSSDTALFAVSSYGSQAGVPRSDSGEVPKELKPFHHLEPIKWALTEVVRQRAAFAGGLGIRGVLAIGVVLVLMAILLWLLTLIGWGYSANTLFSSAGPSNPPAVRNVEMERPVTGQIDARVPNAGKVDVNADQPGKFTIDGVDFEFAWCPPGTFKMGSPADKPDRYEDEDDTAGPGGRQVDVTISQGFWLARTETTQAQFQALTGRNPSWCSAAGGGKDEMAGMDTANFPVEFVTWYDAVEYCNLLSTAAGLPSCYEITGLKRSSDGGIESATVKHMGGKGFRLPTEAEWEYACRAGTKSAYWFMEAHHEPASALGKYAWYWENSGRRTQPVGSKPANPWGLFDMHGNCWEWTGDGYADRLVGGSDPRNDTQGQDRVVRGGSWSDYARITRSANRYRYSPGNRYYYIGFRVARTP